MEHCFALDDADADDDGCAFVTVSKLILSCVHSKFANKSHPVLREINVIC